MKFDLLHPWLLVLLPVVLLPWWRFGSSRRATLGHSDTSLLAQAGGSFASRIRFLLPLARSVVLALLVLALARPVKADEQTRVRVEGIAIELVVDRSSSMLAMDFTVNGEPVDRLPALSNIADDFVDGGAGLGGSPNDPIGAVTFARFADDVCPLTLDHDHLLAALKTARIADTPNEDGTAIGDAMALAVERLKDASTRGENAGPRVKSRVMVLLTDGENNAGDIDPLAAAELARTFGIRIYTIGMGRRGMAPVPQRDVFGNIRMMQQPVSIDEDLLKKIAESSGGQYFRATDSSSLRAIYEEIDRLEKSETEAQSRVQYADLAVDSVRVGRVPLPPILTIAAAALLLEIALASTRFRSLT